MTETATFSTRVIPHGHLTGFLVLVSLAGASLAGAAALVGVPPAVSVPLLLLVLLVLVRRRMFDAVYTVDTEGLTEELTPLDGGASLRRTWTWDDVRSYMLDREPTRSLSVRNVLLIRTPDTVIRVREPADAAGREAHARLVDRFVGYATGDVDRGVADAPRQEEGAHRRPLTSGEAPQLRRTLAHQRASRSVPGERPFLDRPTGRVVAGVSAFVILLLVGVAAANGLGFGNWFQGVFVLIPSALWLAWRAVRTAPR